MALWTPPRDWPVVEPGLLMAGVDDVMLIHSDDSLTEAGFQRHVEALAEAIDGRREGTMYRRRLRRGDVALRRREAKANCDARS